jgi:dihydroorotate dehydrogenase electron transfer subunit
MKTGGKTKHLAEAVILWNLRAGGACYRMGIGCHPTFETAEPGQFVMIRLQSHAEPLLRRPFSIHDLIWENNRISGIEILYKVIGTGTEKLAGCRKGDVVDILGPLGNGFSLVDPPGSVFMAAGGIGVAPFLFLSKTLLKQGVDASRIVLFFGGRSTGDLAGLKSFEKLGITIQPATEDGSTGVKGMVTVPLVSAIRATKPDILYACGPVPMLKTVTSLSADHDVRCEISIETMMACGMGACLGCAVESRRTGKRYLHACVDGPVFDARQIIL